MYAHNTLSVFRSDIQAYLFLCVVGWISMNVFGNKLPQKRSLYQEYTTFSDQLVFSSNELKFYAEAISMSLNTFRVMLYFGGYYRLNNRLQNVLKSSHCTSRPKMLLCGMNNTHLYTIYCIYGYKSYFSAFTDSFYFMRRINTLSHMNT